MSHHGEKTGQAGPAQRAGGRARLLTALAWVALLGWAAWIMATHWDFWPMDLSALYMAGRMVLAGLPAEIYAAPDTFFGPQTSEVWKAEIAAQGLPGGNLLPFAYPPIWAGVMALPARLDPMDFARLARLAILAMLLASLVLAWRVTGRRLPLWAWLGIGAVILSQSWVVSLILVNLQPQVLVVFLMLLALDRVRSGAEVSGGIALGLAAAIKITPIALVLVLLAVGARRAALWSVATAAALAALSLAVMGAELHWSYLAQLERIGANTLVSHVQMSLGSLLAELLALARGEAEPVSDWIAILPAAAWVKPVSLVLLGAGLWAIWRLGNRLDRAAALAWLPPLVVLLTTVTGPIGWTHYALFPLLLLPAAATLGPGRAGWAIVAALFVLFSHDLNLWLMARPLPPHWGAWTAFAGSLGLAAIFVSLALAQARGPRAAAALPGGHPA